MLEVRGLDGCTRLGDVEALDLKRELLGAGFVLDELLGREFRVDVDEDVRFCVRVLSITYRLVEVDRLGIVLWVGRWEGVDRLWVEGMRVGVDLCVLG